MILKKKKNLSELRSVSPILFVEKFLFSSFPRKASITECLGCNKLEGFKRMDLTENGIS